MLLNFFRHISPASLMGLLLVSAGLWLHAFVTIHPVYRSPLPEMPLYTLTTGWINSAALATVCAFILAFIGALLVNRAINQNDIFDKRSYLPALFYLIFIGCSGGLQQLHPFHFSNLLLTLALQRIIETYRKDYDFPGIFDAGLFVSLASLFYLPSIAFIFLLVSGILLIRPFSWRDWVVALLGFITPYAFAFTYYYWTNGSSQFLESIAQQISGGRIYNYDLTLSSYLLMAGGAAILFMAAKKIVPSLNMQKIKTAKFVLLLLWSVPIFLLSLLLAPDTSISSFAYLAIPFGVICSMYYTENLNWMQEVYYLLFVVILFIHLWS